MGATILTAALADGGREKKAIGAGPVTVVVADESGAFQAGARVRRERLLSHRDQQPQTNTRSTALAA
jgi:hypothetical protein